MKTTRMLNAQELYYLAEYKNIPSLFGIPYKEPNDYTIEKLVQKNILTKKGAVSDATVVYVELLKKYSESYKYIHIQDYIFGLAEDGLCVILKQIGSREDVYYELLVGDALLMVQTVLHHPIMKQSAQEYYDANLTQRKAFTYFTLGEFTLVMEIFDHAYLLEEELVIGMKNKQLYFLDSDYRFQEPTSINAFEWLVTRIPQIQSIAEQILTGER
ncbi:DUF5081 family protein [Listeria sp. ILCC792]|uniref:DUF5081 family protein n=1 Tax=Listeria sp. ILCC792 TaxID=1918331 RepID=UPI000B58C20F|nr:DUF5081 family protein [Listeria sp. ILCC792]